MFTSSELDAARRALAVLRSMRGGAGKLAQFADFVDPSWVPREHRAELEVELAELRLGTPEPLPAKRVERLLRDAWGGKLSNHLAELDLEPAAPASAGQVHRGELDDGRVVAVKVQHPGLEAALRADLGNLSLLAQLATTSLPGLDTRAIAAELRDRTLEEMDLEQEAQSQRRFARAFRGHPFVHVPAPVTELTRTDVMVSEWVEGTPFDGVLALGDADRDRYGEILIRFHVGAMLHLGAFHADPHPGNHLLRSDGKVAFIDFGSVGRAEPAWLAGLLDAGDAADAGDGRRLARDLAELGYLAEPEAVDEALLLSALESLPKVGEGARELVARHGRLPARDLLAGLTVGGLGAVLMRLRATVPWDVLEDELRIPDAACSALGQAEAGFWASRGHSRASAVHDLRRTRW